MPKLILNGREYANNKPDGYPPIIYSDEEREVGVWRDGRPLYQKTILCNLTSGTSATAHNIENLDFVVSLRGITNKRCNGDTALIHTEQREINYLYSKDTDLNVSMLAWYSGAYINSENIVIQSGTSISEAHDKVYMVVQYTKTTDTPGSGKWTTYGEFTHHYSTTEQVVGTWIDGKPLYERTYSGLSIAISSANSWYNTSITITNLGKIVQVSGIDAFNQSFPLYGGISNNVNIVIGLASLLGSNSRTIETINLQYTKTTD